MTALDENGRVTDEKLAVLALVCHAIVESIPNQNVTMEQFRDITQRLRDLLSVAEMTSIIKELAERRAEALVN